MFGTFPRNNQQIFSSLLRSFHSTGRPTCKRLHCSLLHPCYLQFWRSFWRLPWTLGVGVLHAIARERHGWWRASTCSAFNLRNWSRIEPEREREREGRVHEQHVVLVACICLAGHLHPCFHEGLKSVGVGLLRCLSIQSRWKELLFLLQVRRP